MVPPPTAEVSRAAVLTDRVQRSLKRSYESEVLPGLFKQFIQFVNTKELTPALAVVSLAPAALGAPPPDDSFPSLPCPTSGVEGSASSTPDNPPDLGIDRRLEDPSLVIKNVIGRSGLYAHSRASRFGSGAGSVNSSGMLNQTGQVDRHIFRAS